jgi:hypothetical protein
MAAKKASAAGAIDPTALDAVAARAWCASTAAAIDAGTAPNAKKDGALVDKVTKQHASTWLGTLEEIVDLRASTWHGGFLRDVVLGRAKTPVSAWASAAGSAELAHAKKMRREVPSTGHIDQHDEGFAQVLTHPSLTSLEKLRVDDSILRALKLAADAGKTIAWTPLHVVVYAFNPAEWIAHFAASPLTSTRALTSQVGMHAPEVVKLATTTSTALEDLRVKVPMGSLLELWPQLPSRVHRLGTAFGTGYVVVAREASGSYAVEARGNASAGMGTRDIADALAAIAQWAEGDATRRVRTVVVEHASKDKLPAAYVDTLQGAVARLQPIDGAVLPVAGASTRTPFL